MKNANNLFIEFLMGVGWATLILFMIVMLFTLPFTDFLLLLIVVLLFFILFRMQR